MSFASPQDPAPVTDERELLLLYIALKREQVVATARRPKTDEPATVRTRP